MNWTAGSSWRSMNQSVGLCVARVEESDDDGNNELPRRETDDEKNTNKKNTVMGKS